MIVTHKNELLESILIHISNSKKNGMMAHFIA